MRRRKSKYTKRSSASTRRRVITAILSVTLSLALVVGAAIAIGSILKKKLDSAAEKTHDYITPKNKLVEFEAKTKNVNAYSYTFGKDATAYVRQGIADLSVCLRYSDGSIAYHSTIAEEIGLDGMDSGCDLSENVEYIHKCGGYAIGTMYINSFAEKKSGVEIIKREYEKQVVIEAADSGIDDILILGLDVSRDNISDVLIFLSDIKKESLDTKIGISISYQDLLEDKNGEYLASMLLMVVDFIALDSKSVPCVENETLGEMKSFEERIDSLHYYMKAYNLRLLFDEMHVALYEIAGAMGINNRQMIH